jgi:hypothetical protein
MAIKRDGASIAFAPDPTLAYLYPPAVNDSGSVAYSAVLASGERAVRVGDTSLYDTSGEFASIGQSVAINASGRVAFFANLDSPAGTYGLFTGTGGATTPIALSSGVIAPSQARFSMNDAGEVAFEGGVRGSSIAGIYKGSGGSLTTVAQTGAIWGGLSAPSINNFGQVAFRGVTRGFATTGIFTGPDPVADKVVAVGDALDGSTITDVQFYTEGFNDYGQVAFYARLANGRDGFYRADPPGMNQSTPALPEVVEPGRFRYSGVPTCRWVDPPWAYGYDYVMTEPGVLFTRIVQFPTGFSGKFTVTAEGTDLGEFAAGEGVDFLALLGHGVASFRVTGISPLADAGDPLGFPLQISFSAPTASFEQIALVPEPGTMLSAIAGLFLLWRGRRNRMGAVSDPC